MGEMLARQAVLSLSLLKLRGYHPWSVHATARDLGSEASKVLQAQGVKLFKGTWDDEEPLSTAPTGCSKLFLNPYTYPSDQGEEVHQSNLILTTAKAAAVTQVVSTSIFGTQNPEKMRHQYPLVTKVQGSKGRVEDLVRAAGFDFWTILRPGNFMANFLLPKAVTFAGTFEEYLERKNDAVQKTYGSRAWLGVIRLA